MHAEQLSPFSSFLMADSFFLIFFGLVAWNYFLACLYFWAFFGLLSKWHKQATITDIMKIVDKQFEKYWFDDDATVFGWKWSIIIIIIIIQKNAVSWFFY